jgi:putative ATPase
MMDSVGWTRDNYKLISSKPVTNYATIESLKSAVQKSIRGSDPDAACLYAYELLQNNGLEILCRRLRVIVSEDIGLTDPTSVTIVSGLIDNALNLGMPEARIPVIEAVLYMSLQPKSNSVMQVLSNLSSLDLNKAVPPSNISSEYAHGYIYPHDFPNHYVAQNYMPENLVGTKVYNPDSPGAWESARLSYWNKLK